MRSYSLILTLALSTLAFLGEKSAQAQNTYADFPFNQGSLFYRPSGLKPPATTSPRLTFSRRPFWRQRGTTYAAQPARTYTQPVAPQYAPGYTYPPQTAAPRYYYPATR